MKKYISIFLLSCLPFLSYCQNVGINKDGSAPDPSAMLDVSSTNKGMLVPRMTTAQRTIISSPAKGLLVFDTDNNSFWFFNGAIWSQLSGIGNVWKLSGNSGTNSSTDFLGTTDDNPLHFRIKNINAGLVDSSVGNTAFGFRSMDLMTTATDQFNTAFGYKSLSNNTSGLSNTAVGGDALFNNTWGSNNTANGLKALFNNTSGGTNTAFGSSALFSGTTGNSNTANGYEALYNNISGSYNTANGIEALYNNTTADGNTANGSQALFYNTSGTQNCANGYAALLDNTTGSFNTADGYGSLLSNNTGNYNTGVGLRALSDNITGSSNTAIGNYALSNLLRGSKNIAIGDNSGIAVGSPNVRNTISIGNDGYLNAADNQAFIGNLSTAWIGGNVNWSTFSDARIKTNIKEDVKGLDFIMKLRPVTYSKSMDAIAQLTGNKQTTEFASKHDADRMVQSGFLAQEVEQVAKDVKYDFSGLHVPANSKQLYSLSYSEFVVPLVKAMQEQQKMIEDLKKEIELLKLKNK